MHDIEIKDTLVVCVETYPNKDGDVCEKCKIGYYNNSEWVIQ